MGQRILERVPQVQQAGEVAAVEAGKGVLGRVALRVTRRCRGRSATSRRSSSPASRTCPRPRRPGLGQDDLRAGRDGVAYSTSRVVSLAQPTMVESVASNGGMFPNFITCRSGSGNPHSVRAEMSHLFRTVRYLRGGHCRIIDQAADTVLSGNRLVPGSGRVYTGATRPGGGWWRSPATNTPRGVTNRHPARSELMRSREIEEKVGRTILVVGWWLLLVSTRRGGWKRNFAAMRRGSWWSIPGRT